MRLHVGFMMDPTADRGPDRVPPRSGCGICGGSPAAAPPDGKFPMRAKRVRRARRSMGSGAGEGRPAIRWKAREAAADAIVRGSGCLCACGARVTHAICKRYRRYIPTQIFSTAAYLLQLYLYAEYATADILCEYSLRRSIAYAHITHPAFLPPTFLTSHPQSRSHLSSFPQRKYIKENRPSPFCPWSGSFASLQSPPISSPRSLRSLGEVVRQIYLCLPKTVLAPARASAHNASHARTRHAGRVRNGRSSSAGMGRCGCGGLAVTECWAVTECELCTVHKWGAAAAAGVIGGYGGVTAGLRGDFFGFAGGFVQYCGRGVFWPFPENCSKFLRGIFGRLGEMCSKSRDCTFLTF